MNSRLRSSLINDRERVSSSANQPAISGHSEICRRFTSEPNAHENVLSTIGNTPIIRINKLAPAGVNLFVKAESFNPLGSIKDRVALGIIEAAEADGSLKPGQTVIEATSGNTGIGLAMVCAQKGYPLVVVMAENFSIERRRLMRYLGAKVILTPASGMGSGMMAKAIDLADKHGWFLCRQFSNDANSDTHSKTTAEEILHSFPAGLLTHFTCGCGTGGTLKGVAKVLREKSPDTRIIAVEPENSAMLSSGITQEFDDSGNATAKHPAFNPHPIQGWSPDFISKLTHDAQVEGFIDDIVPVSSAESLRMARELARREGIFCGISGGATFAGAIEVAQNAPFGSNILCVLPDTGERYLSTPLFDDVSDEMSEEEIALAATTEGFRFDKSKAKQLPKPAPARIEKPDNTAQDLIDSILREREEPIIIFSLEWCEYCWSVEKLFKKMNVRFGFVHLDADEFKKNALGEKIQNALIHYVSSSTIPQVFVGGDYLGGCTRTLKAFDDGSLISTLDAKGINYDIASPIDTKSLLPAWAHPRG